MLISSYMLCGAKKCYDDTNSKDKTVDDKPMNKTLAFVLLVLALTLFIMELIVLVYAVRIALSCSQPGANRVAHVVLALFFTAPYLLIALFFSPCVKKL